MSVSQRRFHSAIQRPSAEALEMLAAYQQEILNKWQNELEILRIAQVDLLAEVPCGFVSLAERLRRSEYPEFRLALQSFGGTLAQRGIGLGNLVTAINRLFEISVPYLAQHDTNGTTPILALARIHALVVLLVVSGYTGERAAGKKPLVEASLIETEGHRRNASAYVTRIYEQERQRFSRDLHDEVGHDLILLGMQLEMIAADIRNKERKLQQKVVLPRLNEAIGLVSHVLDSVRRLVLDLGPAVFDEMRFLPAVRTFITQFSSRTKIPVTLTAGDLPDDIPRSHQVALYRLLQGALSNVLKHASAKDVVVSLACVQDSAIVLVIEDNGVGFDMKSMPERHSFGLTAMRERVEVLDGRMRIQSKPASKSGKRHGTRIEVDLPLPGKAM